MKAVIPPKSALTSLMMSVINFVYEVFAPELAKVRRVEEDAKKDSLGTPEQPNTKVN